MQRHKNLPHQHCNIPRIFLFVLFRRFYYFGCWLRIWRHLYPVNNWNQWRYHFEICCSTLHFLSCYFVSSYKCNTSFEVDIFMLKFDIYLGLLFVISDWNKKKTTFPAYSLVWLILVNFTSVRPSGWENFTQTLTQKFSNSPLWWYEKLFYFIIRRFFFRVNSNMK